MICGSGVSLSQQDVDGEGVLGFAVCVVQRRDSVFSRDDYLQNLETGKLSVRVVVGGVAEFLGVNEVSSKLLYS